MNQQYLWTVFSFNFPEFPSLLLKTNARADVAEAHPQVLATPAAMDWIPVASTCILLLSLVTRAHFTAQTLPGRCPEVPGN